LQRLPTVFVLPCHTQLNSPSAPPCPPFQPWVPRAPP
jgi:hypothetical protein